jgi:hypothetical protein
MEKSTSLRQMLGTPRQTWRSQHTVRHAYISTLKLGCEEEEKGQLREWMTVARD